MELWGESRWGWVFTMGGGGIWVVAVNHGVGGYNTPTTCRNAWGLINGICAGNMILLGEKSGKC